MAAMLDLGSTRTRRWRLVVLALALLASVLMVLPAAGPAEAAPPDGPDKLADFEGLTLPDEFFAFFGGSTVAANPVTVADSDPLARPDQDGDNDVLEVAYNVTDFGGFGAAYVIAGPQDWSTTEGFSFWYYGTGSGLTYQVEISDNRSDPGIDTSERFDYAFTDTTAGWQHMSIPWSDFTRATDFQPGGAPDDGFTLTEIWAWAIVLPLGADTIYFDDFALNNIIIDDFEAGLPFGTDGNGIPIGFHTFQDAGSTVAIGTAAAPPVPTVPKSHTTNNVLQVDLDVSAFAGVIHSFENAAVDTWVPQDWSASEAFAFWLHGNGSGTSLFIDVLENRNPGSTTDDAERWTVAFVDNFLGWQYFEFPFADFVRKGVGNSAPNDGLSLFEVHGWAFGALGTGGPQTYYMDDVSLVGVAGIPELTVNLGATDFPIEEGTTGDITVKLSRPMGADDPAQVSVDYEVETVIAEAGKDYVQPAPGTLTFVNGGASEMSFSLETLEDAKYEGTERLILRISNPVDVALGAQIQSSASIIDDDPYDPLLLDDFESGAYLWDGADGLALTTYEIGAGDAHALPGQGSFESVLRVAPSSGPSPMEIKQNAADELTDLLPTGDIRSDKRIKVARKRIRTSMRRGLWSSDYYLDATRGSRVFAFEREALGLLQKVIDGGGPEAGAVQDAAATLISADAVLARSLVGHATAIGSPRRVVRAAERALARGDSAAAAGDALRALAGYRQAWSAANDVVGLTGAPLPDARFGRDFAIGHDWTDGEALSFWYYGTKSREEITVELLDNRAADPGPSGWSMVWSDEFNDPAGTPPNPANWGYEIGDGTVNGIPGWGNSELQYYTDSTDNSATDGAGNLVITLAEADGSVDCYYGPCEYTSARLISSRRAEFAYGRVESRILVPDGDEGLWPAFWSLGTDIDLVGWPQTGEIDIMEYVSRVPDEIFGTIHGPGYSGGAAYGNTHPFPGGVSTDYHTFAIEWQPDQIDWYVDDIHYHTATPADVSPNEWVFNDPIFLILNLAVGGSFGGPVSDDTVFPQELKVDYVRVYQGHDTAERFEASFVDNKRGWRQIVVPFSDFARSAHQPVGAPDDGLGLDEVWGYGFRLPDGGTELGSVKLDQVRLELAPPPTEIVVTNLDDSGNGSLREAILDIADGGTITFDPGLAPGTIALTSGPLVVDGKTVNIDGSGAPGIAVDGGGADRVLIVEAGASAMVGYLTLSGGFGWQLGGCVLNNGALTLHHATVTGCTMATDAGDFWQGGGGIYSGGGATLDLVHSTVADNTAGWSGGGVYGFFDTTTTIVDSTISGNVSADVGGAIRSLGNIEIVNSTISGNEATGWYGGAAFITDGVVNVINSTIADNISPPWAAADMFVGTFTDAGATLTLTNTIVSSAQDGCFAGFFGGGTVTLTGDHNNVLTDGTCSAGATDLVVADALIGPLADNGGPTLTHALLAGSAAIDAADGAACPATDQRGVARPQGGGCDVGAFELE